MEEYIGKSTDKEGGSVSDYWIFDDEYVREIQYMNNGEKNTRIHKIKSFLKDDSQNPKLQTKVKNFLNR